MTCFRSNELGNCKWNLLPRPATSFTEALIIFIALQVTGVFDRPLRNPFLKAKQVKALPEAAIIGYRIRNRPTKTRPLITRRSTLR